MIADDLEREFATRGIRHGRALLLDERGALALIDKAAIVGVAIRAIDQVRRHALDDYSALKGADLRDDLDRTASWDHARRFVRSLAGRDLLFEIVLDDHTEAREVARGFLTHAQTRSALIVAIFLIGMVGVFMLLASWL